MSLHRIRIALLALFMAIFLAACGGSDDPPPYASAQEVAVAYTRARNLFDEPDYGQFRLPDGRYHISITVDGRVVYDEILFDLTYWEGVLDDNTPLHVVWDHHPRDRWFPTTTFFYGYKKFDLSNITAERGGKMRQIVVYDVRKGIGDWFIIAGAEAHLPDDPDYGTSHYYWATVDVVTGEILGYGYY